MAKRQYSDTERGTALALLDTNRGNVARTSRETEIPQTTIRDWRDGHHHPKVADIREEKKVELAALFEEKAYLLLGGITEEKVQTASVKDSMTGVGIGSIRSWPCAASSLPTSSRSTSFSTMAATCRSFECCRTEYSYNRIGGDHEIQW